MLRLSLAFLLLLLAVPCAAEDAATPPSAQSTLSEGSAASELAGKAPAAPATPVAAPAAPVEPVARAEAVVPVGSVPPSAATQARPRWSPPADGAARAELEAVEARIREIHREMPRLTGPIALMAVGGASAFITVYSAFLFRLVNAFEYDDDEYDDGHRREDRKALGGLGAATLVSLGMLAGGGAWLGKRLRERREYKPELDMHKYRRKQLLQELRFGPNVHGQHYGLSLSAKF